MPHAYKSQLQCVISQAYKLWMVRHDCTICHMVQSYLTISVVYTCLFYQAFRPSNANTCGHTSKQREQNRIAYQDSLRETRKKRHSKQYGAKEKEITCLPLHIS